MDKNIFSLIEKSVKNNPITIALTHGTESFTYQELLIVIRNLSSYITKHAGVAIKDKYIPIYISSPVQAIITQLAILHGGGICVPLDSDTPLSYYPLNKLNNIACILTDKEELLHEAPYPVIQVPKTIDNNLTFAPESLLDTHHFAEHTHCIMTSGTTGTSKAVLLKQEGVINQIFAKIKLLNITNNDKVCFSMKTSFVASIWQIYAPLFVGGTLVVLSKEEKSNPYSIFKAAQKTESTILCTVPSVMRTFLSLNTGTRQLPLRSLTNIVLTGESLSASIVKPFYEKYDIQLINAYGQSECSDDTFHYVVPKDFASESSSIPIGYPIENITYAIVDGSGQPVKAGEIGELYIAGLCLSPGYIGDKTLTKSVFNKTAALNGDIAFSTGDLVSQSKEGYLICHGRKDNQIKINGNRIEPEAIEFCCMKIHEIEDALVIKKESQAGEYISLYYVIKEGIAVEPKYIKRYLSKQLPAYMLPSEIVKIDKIYFNSNGKKIRKVYAKECKTEIEH